MHWSAEVSFLPGLSNCFFVIMIMQKKFYAVNERKSCISL